MRESITAPPQTFMHSFPALPAHVRRPDRAELLAAALPATAAQDTARREKQAAALHKRLHRIDTAENAHAREIEALACTGKSHAAGVTALRTRIVARFDELEAERATIGTQLAALTKAAEPAGDPALLDALPTLTDIHDAPARLLQQLFQAFDIQLLYSKDTHQVTGRATITSATPQAVAAIIADSDDGHPAHTSPATTSTGTPHTGFSDPFRTPMCAQPTALVEGRPGDVRDERFVVS
jgi:hypothetical protein